MIRLLDFGQQPISGRFLNSPLGDERTFPISLAQCSETGLIQLEQRVPYAELVPRFSWASYKEPEEHLDWLVEKILKLCKGKKRMRVGGLSLKDSSTVERFRKRGHLGWVIDPIRDLNLNSACGVESIQAKLTGHAAERISRARGKVDLLIARHIWEHAYNLEHFSAAISELLDDDGWILVEVPNCRPLLKCFDYTMTWEEHSYYFTRNTFLDSLDRHNLLAIFDESLQSDSEELIVALVQKKMQIEIKKERFSLVKELEIGATYARNFRSTRAQWTTYLRTIKKRGPVALFGVGHLSIAFVNYLGLKEYIDFAVDDNVNKQGLFLPGARTPIISTRDMEKRKPILILFGVGSVRREFFEARWRKAIGDEVMIRSIFPEE